MNASGEWARQATSQLSQLYMKMHDVQIIETDASIGCGLRANILYELAVELSQIVLRQDNQVLFVWPLKHVRRYGYTSNSFSFEAGSKCITGEGLFIFRCNNAIQLYNQAIASVDRIKQLKSRQLLQTQPKIIVPSAMPFDEKLFLETDLMASSGAQPERAGISLLTPIPKKEFSSDASTDQIIPHYVRNNCEYAEVMKRRESNVKSDSQTSNQQSTPLLRINTTIDQEPYWVQSPFNKRWLKNYFGCLLVGIIMPIKVQSLRLFFKYFRIYCKKK